MNKKLKLYFLILIFILLLVIIFLVGLLSSTGNTLLFYPLAASGLTIIITVIIAISVNEGGDYISADSKNIQFILNNEVCTFGTVGLIILDPNGTIIWINKYIRLLLKKKYIGVNINKIINKDILKKLYSSKICNVTVEQRHYEVKYIPEYNSILLRDKTVQNSLAKSNIDESLAIGLINLENLNAIVNNLPEKNKISVSENVYGELIRWSEKAKFFLQKFEEDRYIIVSNRKGIMEGLKKKIFDQLISKVSKSFERNNLNSNILIGISFGLSEPDILFEESEECIKMAMNRGGDQAVIRDCNKLEYIFIGGEKLGNAVFNRTDLKIFSRQFKKIILDSNNVLITGHRWADYDALGSALGIYYLCKEIYNKETKIIIGLDTIDKQTLQYLKEQIPKKEFKKIYLVKEDLKNYITANTLLIVLDTNLKERTEVENSLNEFSNIVVIDHHNVSKNYIDDSKASYIDVHKSSTCEIISEILNNLLLTSQIKKVPQWTLDILLTGIILDTNNFKSKVNNRTFFVSNLLLSWGSNLETANKLLENPYNETIIKNQIISTLFECRKGYYIAYGKDNLKINRATIGLTAQEIVEIKGVNASFVVCYDKTDNVYVSCRSISSEINVQLIAEKLGGGGSFNSAAIQFNGATIKEVIQNLINQIET